MSRKGQTRTWSKEEVIEMLKFGNLHIHLNKYPYLGWVILNDGVDNTINSVKAVCQDKERCIKEGRYA